MELRRSVGQIARCASRQEHMHHFDRSLRLHRRAFLRQASLGLGLPLLGGALANCTLPAAQQTMPAALDGGHTHRAEGPHAPAALATAVAAVDAMDAEHEAGVRAFLAGVDSGPHGNQPLAARLEQGVKVFDLTASKLSWQVAPDQRQLAYAYNGQVPGPEIRVTEGDRVRVNFTNALDESTAIHWHGVLVPNPMDGVTYLTQPPVKPGEQWVYEFTVRNSGSHMYHAHHNSAVQVGGGLLGAFIAEPQAPSQEPTYDREVSLILNDMLGGFTINGKSFPATQPIRVKLGQKLRIRYFNQGQLSHPMHLHGMPQLVFARDGYALPQPYLVDTLSVAPAERWDVLVDCSEPGVWAFHCHILSHAESAHGMFGMVTALIVEL
jgi:manganese oxidase